MLSTSRPTSASPTPSESSQESSSASSTSSGTSSSSSSAASNDSSLHTDAPTHSSTIKIFARVRPLRKNTKLQSSAGRYWTHQPDTTAQQGAEVDSEDVPRIGFKVPRDEAQGLINNQKETYEFRFDRVFDVDTRQEEVFDYVAKDVVLSVMDGYNGTIFAYGQTGSGKTFTITGGAERYADRGLIPRTIQFMFKEMQKRAGYHYEIKISYLEIYNETGYDLLFNSRETKKLEDLPKVSLQEDAQELIHLKNLTSLPALSEEEALNLLFVGDTNRMIAETPSNPASSRSHCIFIIAVTSGKVGGDTIRKSKLHLVDLAGSERVSRTHIDGTLLKEAKYINLSLHYLEQVIIALHEKSLGKRTHIPYRNSMMTSVLRDSLGGNCKTTMIATVAVEDELIDESISTCRFAQRVALISNNATLNEEQDPQLVIARLKRENARLRAELAIARGEAPGEGGEELPDYEKERVKQAVDDYLADNSPEAQLLFSDYRKIHEAFKLLKQYVLNARATGGGSESTRSVSRAQNESKVRDKEPKPDSQLEKVSASGSTSGVDKELMMKVEKLKRLVAHRDNEINVLIGVINQYKARHGDVSTGTGAVDAKHAQPDVAKKEYQLSFISTENYMSSTSVDSAPSGWTPSDSTETRTTPSSFSISTQPAHPAHTTATTTTTKSGPAPPATTTIPTTSAPSVGSRLGASVPQLTTEKARAFEIFKSGYPSSGWIDGQKALLKKKYGEAKGLGERANALRNEIS
ncbi:Kinesin- protein 6 [Quaeritorhiza haematococci]|nr:Kinesin- protein 6 [Quaeritorhiza haematococci]